MRPLLVYISGHGFGHAVRVCAVLRALRRLHPDVALLLRTPVPRWFLLSELGEPFEHTAVSLDVGAVQRDSLSLDADATLAAAAALVADAPARLETELAATHSRRPAAVFADIPALAFDIGTALGVPAIGMANFSWDWIYADYLSDRPAFAPVIAALRASYRHATVLLRLPWHGDLDAFPHIRDVPLVARTPSLGPTDVRRRLDLPAQERLVLLSFGGIGLDITRVPQRDGVTFLATQSAATSGTPPCRFVSNAQMAAAGVRYEDLVAASDAVITKPGYGIVADCIASGTPIIYTDRGRFAEYPILVEGIRHHLPHAFVSNANLHAGDWQAALDAVLDSPRPTPSIDVTGADHVAGVLAAYLAETG